MAVSLPPPNVEKTLKLIHKKSFEYVSKALAFDENGAERSVTIEAYKKGIEELKKGTSLNFDSQDDATRQRLTRLQEKMKKNLTMSLERIQELEKDKQDFDPTPEIKPPKPTSNNASPRPKSAPKHVPPTSNNASPRPKSAPKPVPPKTVPKVDSKKSDPQSYSASRKTVIKPNDPSTPPPGSKKRLGPKFRGLDKEIVDKILNEVVEEKISVSFSDIAGNDVAKEALREIVIYPMLRPDLYTGLRSPTRGVLLFGPPGNGKTLLAKAVAFESKCVFFNISAASLMSKWVGESEKMVRALFTMARELQPCIIFMDEIDSLLSARQAGDKDVTRRVLNEFLQEFDGARTSDTDQILIMGATNRPFELDDAALRRFPKRIQIKMPDAETRFQLLKLLLKKEGNPLSEKDLLKIAKETEYYSSSDLTHLAKDAAMGPLRSLDRETFQSIPSSDVRKLQFSDFEASLKKVRPTLTSNSLKNFEEWNKEFGDISC